MNPTALDAIPRWGFALGGLLPGALVGSYIATLVIRWPAGRSALAGRSACDACGGVLPWRAMIPLVSHVLQRGRCRACGAAIDRRHLQIEAGAALIGASALWVSPDLAGLAGAGFGLTLLALAALDIDHYWLPDRLTLPLMAAGLTMGMTDAPPPFADRIAGALAGFAALALVALGYRRLRGREGLGGGDAKLLGAIGAWLGWAALPLLLLAAALLGLSSVMLRRWQGEAVSATDRLPFGALLAATAWPIWLMLAAI